MSTSERDIRDRELREARERLQQLETNYAALEKRMIEGAHDGDSPMARCEKTGGHRVTPKVWPPPKPNNPNEAPSLAEICVRCGCHVIVYDRPQPGVNVIHPPSRERA